MTDIRRAAGSPLAVQVLGLIAARRAVSRAEIAAALGAPQSTISVTVGKLLAMGAITESGTQASDGGRPRKILRLGAAADFAVAADIGGHHARIGVVRPGGAVLDVSEVALDVSMGPEPYLRQLAGLLESIAKKHATTAPRGVGVSVPGPVHIATGTVNLPSRMPGWDGFPVRDWLRDRLAVPIVVENDANCMALAEYAAQLPKRQDFITVKAGSAIGTGIMVAGRLYRGATGVAGDITHVRVEAGNDAPCSCGNHGCLETVASGAGLVRILIELGTTVRSTDDVVHLVRQSEPVATRVVRDAGRYLGSVLAANVNFFNPDAVYLGGALSTLGTFIAAVRGELYRACHPLITRNLAIEPVSLGPDGGLTGAGTLALDASFTQVLRHFRVNL